jgi:hypothetical protein
LKALGAAGPDEFGPAAPLCLDVPPRGGLKNISKKITRLSILPAFVRRVCRGRV